MELLGKLLANTGIYDKVFVDFTNIYVMFGMVYVLIPLICIGFVISYIVLRFAGMRAMNTATVVTSVIFFPIFITGIFYYAKPGNLNAEEGLIKLYNQNNNYEVISQQNGKVLIDSEFGEAEITSQELSDIEKGKAFLARTTKNNRAALVYIDRKYTVKPHVSSHEIALEEANAVIDAFPNGPYDVLSMHNKEITIKRSYQEIY